MSFVRSFMSFGRSFDISRNYCKIRAQKQADESKTAKTQQITICNKLQILLYLLFLLFQFNMSKNALFCTQQNRLFFSALGFYDNIVHLMHFAFAIIIYEKLAFFCCFFLPCMEECKQIEKRPPKCYATNLAAVSAN